MRKIVDARDARTCVKAARAAGLSLGAWARRHGVDGRSLHAWSVNLGLPPSVPARPGLIELVSRPAPPSPGPSPVRYVVRVGETAVEVGEDFEDDTLARVVRVLRAC